MANLYNEVGYWQIFTMNLPWMLDNKWNKSIASPTL